MNSQINSETANIGKHNLSGVIGSLAKIKTNIITTGMFVVIMIVAVVAVGAFILPDVNKTLTDTKNVNEIVIKAVEKNSDMKFVITEMKGVLMDGTIDKNIGVQEHAEKLVREFLADAGELEVLLEKGGRVENAKKTREIKKNISEAKNAGMGMVRSGIASDDTGIDKYMRQMEKLTEAIDKQLDSNDKILNKESADTRGDILDQLINLKTSAESIVVLFLIVTVLAGWLSRKVNVIRTDPFKNCANYWAEKNFGARITDIPNNDIFGELAEEFNRIIDNVQKQNNAILETLKAFGEGDFDRRINAVGLSEEQNNLEAAINSNLDEMAVARRRAEGAVEATRVFEEQIADIVSGLSGQSDTVNEKSSTLASAAEETSVQVSLVADGADQANEAVASVAAATEELSASVSDVTKQVSEADVITRGAVEQAENTATTVGKLGEATNEIGKVVELISEIAEQTNLLALNASIEAARAGDAGRGFAVVANEVKDLANQTASATESITKQIDTLQTESTASASAMNNIVNTIQQLGEITSTVASAANEQATTTQEISQSIQGANANVSEVTSNVTDISTAAQETGTAAADMQVVADELSQGVNQLADSVEGFLNQLNS